ncbi:molybdopterin-dependent oxidoreductase [Propionivibrio dicarboxylicus]|uniref:Anaerobic selenocysteine-containing dehydrogenase n=1 Tax=Propionivibrio dicarboxylicus TaxID=83767 RepID=A0A1G7UWH9_9RHOO|nr:molybdopterin-dependent oxidoreductase [Propionivibrio dicarboxylicus]SDG51902.1 Anaerobic selenocysteine-containing dehydrogenase [Propionivibrio dicarboxylicus]
MTTSSEAPRGLRRSVCPHDCPSVCALAVELESSGLLGRIRGADQSYTDGIICAKVARYAERIHHPERLLHPLRRVGAKGGGCFERISWENAFDLLVERIGAAVAQDGPQAVWPYHYAGTMGLVQRAALRRLGHLAGWSRQRETFCVALADAGWLAGAGVKRGIDTREIVHSDLIVVWGGNPVHTQINFMHWAQKARRARGARLVVVDPYRTPTAAQADVHLALQPGTDGALACAVMHVLLAEGLADRDYLARYTDFSPQIEQHLAARTPQWAAGITGLTVEEIVDFARSYGQTPNSFLRIGFGFTRQRNGSAAMHAVSCLPAVSGAWQHPGGGALFGQSGLYGLNTAFLNGLDAVQPDTRLLDISRLGAVLGGDRRDLGDGPPVRAMIVQNTNPAVVAPESARVRAGLMREDLFLCVHEHFMTDTAQLADLVLPATMFLEHDDLYQASGHTFLQSAEALIPAPGECRSNHAFISELAGRLGVAHGAFGMSAAALIDRVLADSGRPSAAEIRALGGLDCALPFERAHFLDGFGHPDGRFRFAPDWAARGAGGAAMPAFPDHQAVIDAATPAKPFRLVAAPARTFLNTTFTETPTSRAKEGRPTVKVHPEICRTLDLADGEIVALGNALGSVRLHVEICDGMQPTTLIVESQWPNAAFLDGIGINTLISAEPGYPAAGAVYHDTAVWLRRASQP